MLRRAFKFVLVGFAVLLLAFVVAVYALNFHPDPVMSVGVQCAEGAPPTAVPAGATLKVMTWNVQFMAGRGYVFWWELPNELGPDERPTAASVAQTLDEVARIIVAEAPDVVLLQEVDDGAKRTDDRDQLADLISRLPQGRWPCHASAFYWKSAFVPHSRIWGAAGMKLSVLSRYAISAATRFQLTQKPANIVTRQFALKRAVLAVTLPIAAASGSGSGSGRAEFITVLNTHLDAFAQGSDTMTRQVAEVKQLVESLKGPWVLGGDFNLLPDDGALKVLGEAERKFYPAPTELAPLTEAFGRAPSVAQTSSEGKGRWFTHWSNHPAFDAPDRTIDYIFVGGAVEIVASEVRSHDTLQISDHLPVIATIRIPGGDEAAEPR